MKDQSYEDIINDLLFYRAPKVNYKKLFFTLKQKSSKFIQMYEGTFGAPDLECKEFWDLYNELIKHK